MPQEYRGPAPDRTPSGYRDGVPPHLLEAFLEGVLARLPRALRRPVRRAAYFPLDAFQAALRRGRRPLTPPRGLQAVGGGGFEHVGHTFVRLFQDPGGLRPSDRVLDVGCGVGRMAVPLTTFLDAKGTYDGFDVERADVRWCRRAISRRFPRFRFRHVDVQNSEYNPRGRIRPTEFVFPYPDESFDFVFATSVFTHLLAPAAERYLREIARVLAPGGRFFLTVFRLDERTDAFIAEGRTTYRFAAPAGRARVNDAKFPEAAVAYRRADLLDLISGAGLAVSSIDRGGWAGGESASFQDVVTGQRKEPTKK